MLIFGCIGMYKYLQMIQLNLKNMIKNVNEMR